MRGERELVLASMPFRAWRGEPRVMASSHLHTGLELNLLIDGGARYFLAGSFVDVPIGRLFVFWAGVPHRLVRVGVGTRYLCATLPLSLLSGWRLPRAFLDRLVAGDSAVGSDVDAVADRATFERWADDCSRSEPDARDVALLEIRARLHRLAWESSGAFLGVGVGRVGDGGAAERIASYLSTNYRGDVRVENVARAVGLAPGYVMTAFKAATGMRIGEYVLRLRVHHAERLLLSTDRTIASIADESGFGSAGRLYAAFARLVGQTPTAYRKSGSEQAPFLPARNFL